jgi:hypothetical protein
MNNVQLTEEQQQFLKKFEKDFQDVTLKIVPTYYVEDLIRMFPNDYELGYVTRKLFSQKTHTETKDDGKIF